MEEDCLKKTLSALLAHAEKLIEQEMLPQQPENKREMPHPVDLAALLPVTHLDDEKRPNNRQLFKIIKENNKSDTSNIAPFKRKG